MPTGPEVHRRGLARWLGFAFAGVAAAAAAVAITAALVGPGPMRSREVVLAEQLDLFEDMLLMQNQQALEDFDVVAVLHTLEARR